MQKLENALFWILAGLVLLLPLIFIPTVVTPLLSVKYGLLVIAVIAAVVVWILLRLKDGVCLLPINMLNLAGCLVLFVLFLSSLLSGSIWNSLLGQLPQTDTFFFYLYVFIIMFMAPSVFNSAKRILTLYKIFFIPLGLLMIFHVIRLLAGPSWLSFGYFPNISDNLVGKWNDLGIFFGLGVVLSLVSLELLTLSKRVKIFLYSALVILIGLLMIINFVSIWYVLGALALVFFVYSIVIARSGNTKKTTLVPLSITSFVIFLISIVFVVGGSTFGGIISNHFHISQVDVSPTWQTTAGIAKSVLSQGSITRDVFGVGPNRFINEWLLFKPAGVNNSIFWNTDFNSGVGLIPSSLITTGILGLLVWLAFLGILVYMGFRSILSRISDPVQRYLITSSFLASLYLWLFCVIYTPSLVIIVLTFLFTGLFVSSLYGAGILKAVHFEYFKNPKVGFVSVLILIIVLICGLGLVYTTATKFAAAAYYNQGIAQINNGNNNLDSGEQKIKIAISLDASDLYARSLTQIYLVRLSDFLSNSATSTASDTLKNQFSMISNTARSAATFAVSVDGTNYQNWLTMGDVWTALVPLKIDKAYDNASTSYEQALNYDPQNPYIYLEIAKLDSAQNNVPQAKDDLIKALNLKNDYTEAYFQLGVLLYDNKDYTNAIKALEPAVSLDSQNSYAKYFLGLSYYQAGRINDAVAQFSDLQKQNPNNQQLVNILNDIKNGKSLFPKTVLPTGVGTTTKAKVTK